MPALSESCAQGRTDAEAGPGPARELGPWQRKTGAPDLSQTWGGGDRRAKVQGLQADLVDPAEAARSASNLCGRRALLLNSRMPFFNFVINLREK